MSTLIVETLLFEATSTVNTTQLKNPYLSLLRDFNIIDKLKSPFIIINLMNLPANAIWWVSILQIRRYDRIFNPLRTVVPYVYASRKYEIRYLWINCYNFVILSLINLKPLALYSLQPSKHSYISGLKRKPSGSRKIPLKFKTSNYYNLLIAYLLFIAS